ncbi:hypothetical protein M0R45_005258 [Rubus argutus]|uniref:Uncharacterized protein n=1 Tax=Rubus argutus TaxID=59490 RepID=A0AAW1YM60_RUBAR
MESSSAHDHQEQEQQQQQKEERHRLLLSPCHFFEQLINTCLKCLGLDHDYSEKTKADHQQYYPPPQTEMEMKFTEEVVVMSTRALRAKRPPISSGSGGQINYSSS